MFLERLEIQGFKSFASKTVLEFVGPKTKKKGITAVVGPNGSGKSNVADAIRWVLGEQSVKLLRGKKSEDVIFSGSEKKSRSSFAEVTLVLTNEDGKAELDFAEISITRRLYRDGESDYLINNNKVRLQDVQMLLAKANFGERHYSVIGQGMIDSILQLSPEERKDFFDEATGVKPFQIKKDQALSKLQQTEENLMRADALLAEIEPRLRSLARQVKKLEERGTIELELHGLQHSYYLNAWRELTKKLAVTTTALKDAAATREKKLVEVNAVRAEFSGMEKEETRSDVLIKFQQEYQTLLDEKTRVRLQQVEIEGKIARTRAVASVQTPLPLTKIIQEIRLLQMGIEKVAPKLRGARSLEQAQALATEIEQLAERSHSLAERLERPAVETKPVVIDPALDTEYKKLAVRFQEIDRLLADTQKKMQTVRMSENTKKSAVFDAQRKLESKLAEMRGLDQRENDIKVEVARLETRRETLEVEMAQELKERVKRVQNEVASNATDAEPINTNEVQSKIQRLKYQLELIGGIDPEIVKEHAETLERSTFLTTQTDDLKKSLGDLEQVIITLNKEIDLQFESGFHKLSEDFARYFKILFNGGVAKLERVKEEKEHTPKEEALENGEDIVQAKQTLAEKYASERYTIEISANPPGKKVKSVTMLSGGERAMTAIALISAIISNNPSPFVVLDEVDAALDESNSIRFADIVDELAEKSQFIVISHNRYTMEKSSVLYGVTMRDDGTSQILSVNLEDVKSGKTPINTVTLPK